MFVELMTMWKRARETASSQSNQRGEQTTKTISGRFRWISRWTSKLSRASRPTDSGRRSTWRRRRIGILYSRQPRYWVYLVLLEPVDDDLEFCYRIIED